MFENYAWDTQYKTMSREMTNIDALCHCTIVDTTSIHAGVPGFPGLSRIFEVSPGILNLPNL